MKTEGWPLVQGRCPACGHASLFLAAGGFATCSRDDCPDPTAATDCLPRSTWRRETERRARHD